MMKAMILNSGSGKRMGKLTQNKPKCLIELYNGETILERQIRILGQFGIRDFIITTGPFKELIVHKCKAFKNLNFIFVENNDYENTNYIVSMYNARELYDDDILLLHGDLVFNKLLVKKLLLCPESSVCLYNETATLSKKDFKCRINNGYLKEVSVNIFADDCFAFQPMYKLSKDTIISWNKNIVKFIRNGEVKVYAENALNEITDKVRIFAMSYKDDYINEIDTQEDYLRVSADIENYDLNETPII